MTPATDVRQWNRRAFLQSVGAGTLSLASLAEYVPLARSVQGFRFSPVGSGQEFWPVSLKAQG